MSNSTTCSAGFIGLAANPYTLTSQVRSGEGHVLTNPA